jgi:uncharacterized protein YdaT
MPWTPGEYASRHNHSLSKAGASKAASMANAMLRSGTDEGVAIATANKYANTHASKLKKRGHLSSGAMKRVKDRHLNPKA